MHVLYGHCTTNIIYNIHNIEMVQRRNAGFAFFIYDGYASVTQMLNDIGWCTMKQRCENLRTIMMITQLKFATESTNYQHNSIQTNVDCLFLLPSRIGIPANPQNFACIKLSRSLRIALNCGNFICKYKIYYPGKHYNRILYFVVRSCLPAHNGVVEQ